MVEAYGATAVVLGAGIAGLGAAQVLSERFSRVVVIERDALPQGPAGRSGLPHGEHTHGLLAVGRESLERLFPGLSAELVDRGAVWMDIGRELAVWQLGGFRAGFDCTVKVVNVSRSLLEWCLRRRLAGLGNVEVRQAAAAGLAGADDRVTGVRLAGGATVSSDLVVDATGRGTRSDRWLAQLGLPVPTESTIGVRLAYSTLLLHREGGDLGGLRMVAQLQTPPSGKRLGGAMAIDGDRWIVTLGEFHNDHPPADRASFVEFAASLPHPSIAQLIESAEPLSEVAVIQFPASRRRHFERMRRLPAGYLAVGDALCSFNPVYAHGMTVAAVEALALGRFLDRHRGSGPDMARAFYRHVTGVVGSAWELARSVDFAYPQTTGRRPVGFALRDRYLRRVIRAAQTSPKLNHRLMHVYHLIDRPHVLAAPDLLLTTVKATRKSAPDTADTPLPTPS